MTLSTPATVKIFRGDTPAGLNGEKRGDNWVAEDVTVSVNPAPTGIAISVHAPDSQIARVCVRWNLKFASESLFLGDAWERSYGDLQWRFMQPERVLPWYFAAHDRKTGETTAIGVKTQPAAFCFFTVDEAGVSLWLDLRNGGMPCIPGNRLIQAATVVTAQSTPDENPINLIRKLCKMMCEKPRAVLSPICGNNNWYYAYGHNFDAAQVKKDAALLAELAADHTNRPFCVIDAGWSPGGSCPGGPWTAGRPDKFPDMPRLAEEIHNIGVKPGIWIRPTALTVVNDPKRLRPGLRKSEEKALDLTMSENLELIRDDVHRMHQWGFQLIKHDFSTWDALGRWGFEMGAEITDPDWHFADRSLTNAEIILRLYKTIREGAGDAVLIGCNTIGHLGAGLFELQRVGDDTSGQLWERTRRMGVNTLAFRLPQHNTFFQIDADCVAHTENTPWEKDRQWLDLVVRTGTPLFVSVDPTKVSPEVKTVMSRAMQSALTGTSGNVEPLDWLVTTCPSRWRFEEESVQYDWIEKTGAIPLKC